ncbi:6198_t:CDS:1, partial [Cetraspora pellucida]
SPQYDPPPQYDPLPQYKPEADSLSFQQSSQHQMELLQEDADNLF